jgi:hypothetical protein
MPKTPVQISPEEFEARTAQPEEVPPAEQPLDEIETIDGGRRVEVTKRNGKTEKVKIKQFTLDDCMSYDQIRTDLAACVDFYCSKPTGWNKDLEPLAALKIYDIGKAINQGFFDSVMERVRPEVDAALESRGNLAQKLAAILPALGVQSPGSLSSPDAGQNGSQKT